MIALALAFGRRLWARIAGPRGCASGETARGGGIGPDRWRDSVDWPATATSGGLPADSLGCNIAPADAVAGKAVHTLSTGRDAVANTLGLAWEKNGDILELGPREVLLPKVKPRREAPTSHRGVLMRCSLLLTALSPDHTTLSPASRAGHCWPARLAPSSPRTTHRALGTLRAKNWHPHSPLLTSGQFVHLRARVGPRPWSRTASSSASGASSWQLGHPVAARDSPRRMSLAVVPSTTSGPPNSNA